MKTQKIFNLILAALLSFLPAAPALAQTKTAATYAGVYNSGTTYITSAIVTESGIPYISLVNPNLGHDPATDGGTHWAKLVTVAPVAISGSAADLTGLGAVPTILAGFTAQVPFTEATGTVAHDTTSNHNDCTFSTGTAAPLWVTGGIDHLTTGTTTGFCKFPTSASTSDATTANARTVTWCGFIRPQLQGNFIPNYSVLVGSSNQAGAGTLWLSGEQTLRSTGYLTNYTTSGTDFGTRTAQPIIGYHCATITKGSSTDSTLDHLYVDDSEVSYVTQVASWDHRVSGDYDEVGQAAWGASDVKSINITAYVLAYPTALTPAQISNNFHALQFLAFYSRGVGLPPTLNYSKTNQLVCDGDSLMNATPGGVTPPCNSSGLPGLLNGTWNISNVAVASTTVYTHTAEVPLSDGAKCSPIAQYNFAFENGGINDINIGGGSAATLYADRVAWAQATKKVGCTPLWTTLISSASDDTVVQAINALLRAGSAKLGVPIIDLAEEPCLGKTGAYANPSGCGDFQSDGLHETQTGADVMRNIIANDVNYLTGSSEAAPTLITGSSHTLVYGEDYSQVTPSGSTTALTLPSCVGLGSGMTVTVYHAEAAHTVTVAPASGQNVNGGSSAVTVPTLSKLRFIPYPLDPSTAGCGWVSQ